MSNIIATAEHVRLAREHKQQVDKENALKFLDEHWNDGFDAINKMLITHFSADVHLTQLDEAFKGDQALLNKDGKTTNTTVLSNLYRALGFKVEYSMSSNYSNEKIFIQLE